jgi:hypothetical protein
MRRALISLLVLLAVAALASAEERKSWNKVRYIGGTIPIKAGKYDWNTTITITSKPDAVTVSIAPASVFAHPHAVAVRLEPSEISAVVTGPGAWQRVADIPGSQLPSKPPTLFGLLLDRAFLAILFQDADRKPAAILLESMQSWQIARVLEALTGKPQEYAK